MNDFESVLDRLRDPEDFIDDLEPKVQPMSADDYIDLIEFYKNRGRRELCLYTDVMQVSVQEIMYQIRRYNRLDKGLSIEERKPIWLHIFSYGGETIAGTALIDLILQSETPVFTINDGMAASMAGLIYIAGHRRYAMERATLMLHDGSLLGLSGDMSKVKDYIGYQSKWESRMREFVLMHSRLTEKEYDGQSRADWYLLSDYAKEKGLVDYIIGVDCTLKDILPD